MQKLYKNCNKAIQNENLKIKFGTENNIRKNPQETSRFDTSKITLLRLPKSIQTNWRFIKWEVQSVCKIYKINEVYGFAVHILNKSTVTRRNTELC